ncbi:unnamed protein product [Spirodela intermedia]|uniref:Uncharacterized protein n=2 Tax=Spirodela intermedia TaxID=51605 RepID=A0ABN7ED13_SPIIN|nr:unnamed protein product [Spirodela intermedia]CAA6656580.1 unnamed protein product [Spirodela intermedia]CAA6675797.1 unnamed protein product [Spirodela intermedia]CAA7392174.1 unnamed protein product [Spirodela intermedia]
MRATRHIDEGSPSHHGSFILKSAQQEEALHRIWYALRRVSTYDEHILCDVLSMKIGGIILGRP